MCGIVGTIGNSSVATELYEGLIALQHRGQECAGIATYNHQFHVRKGMGLVREVFSNESIIELGGNVGIGHVRYSTIGFSTIDDAQPFMVNSPFGIALAHNGNVYNAWQLKDELFQEDLRYINSTNDAEIILNIFASALSKGDPNHFFDGVCEAVKSVFIRAKGGYSVVAVIAGKGLLAFRDPHGIRPLVWGQRKTTFRTEHMFASENTMFQILGYELVRDVGQGEVIFVKLDGTVESRIVQQKELRPCIFEYVYFARPDSFLNGVSVYRARLHMGENLAKKIQRLYPTLPIDVVIPAPSTASTAALSCSHVLGVRYTEGLVKNHFIGRTFIMPGQEVRQKANKYKLSVIDSEVRNKNVLVVDDSIVRGSVSRHIVNLIRSHGALKVYLASTAPPLRYADLYGIDLPTREEYIAHNRTEEEICRLIQADLLIYQDLEELVEAVTRKATFPFKPHTAYFNGEYPTGVTEDELTFLEQRRKAERQRDAVML